MAYGSAATWQNGAQNIATQNPAVPNASGQLGAFTDWEANEMQRLRMEYARQAAKARTQAQPQQMAAPAQQMPQYGAQVGALPQQASQQAQSQMQDLFVKMNPYTGREETVMPWTPGAVRSGKMMDAGQLDFYSKLGQQVAPKEMVGGGVSVQQRSAPGSYGIAYNPWAGTPGGEDGFAQQQAAALAAMRNSSDQWAAQTRATDALSGRM